MGLADEAKKLLQQAKIETESAPSQRCVLCRLTGEQKEALDTVLSARRDTGAPTWRKASHILAKLGIKTNACSILNHYREHWDGKDKAARKTSR